MQRDVEYQTGRRVEQVVSQPGSIRRIHVVAVVRLALDPERQEQIRNLVAGAVGAATERGDTVLVEAFQPLMAKAAPAEPAPAAASQGPRSGAPVVPSQWLLAAMALPLGLLILFGWLTRSGATSGAKKVALPLSDQQRQLALRRVEAWLHEDVALGASAAGPVGQHGSTP